jgi:hypothetical protein
MTETNVIQSLAKDFRNFLDVAAQYLNDPLVKREVLSNLGLNPDADPDFKIPEESLANIDRFVNSVDPNLEAFLSLLEGILSIGDAIKAVLDAAKFSPEDPIDTNSAAYLILSILAVNFVRLRRPRIYWTARLVGLINETIRPETFGPILNEEFSSFSDVWSKITKLNFWFDRLGFVISIFFLLFAKRIKRITHSEMAQVFSGWDPSPGSTTPLADMISDRCVTLSLVGESQDETHTDNLGARAVITLLPIPEEEGGPALFLSIGGTAPNLKRDLGNGWKLEFNLGSTDLLQFLFPMNDSSKIKKRMGGISNASIRSNLEFSLNRSPDEPPIILGLSDLHLEIKGIEISAEINASSGEQNDIELVTKMIARNCSLVFSKEMFDDLLQKTITSEKLRVNFDLGLGWDTKRGMFFEGGNNLSTTIAVNQSYRLFDLKSISFSIKEDKEEDAPTSVSSELVFSFGIKLGPVVLSIDHAGLQIVFNSSSIPKRKIRYPDGIGVAIDSPGVKGGGFIMRTENQYAGVIELNIRGYTLQAIALLDTGDQTGGISLMGALFIGFKNGIQVGGGFKITKIGGFIGYNRRVSINDIASGIQSGIMDTILFPSDPVHNAPRIIGDFKKVFPSQPGHHLVGPAIQITYLSKNIIIGDLAVIMEFEPFVVSVIGKISSKIPEEHPIIEINVGLLGRIDFPNNTAEFYGSLYNSRISNFAIAGDMAIAASWSPQEKNLIISIGGFNPKFTPPSNFPPFGAPPLKRLNVALSNYVSLQLYAALTSNTIQLGARVDARFSVAGATISGFLSFDALVQFDPLYYVIDIAGGFSVKFLGRSLTSIAFSGFIEGPNPHRIKGSATFSILWWDITRSVDETFGDQTPEIINTVDPWDILKEALEQNESWIADIPSWQVVGVATKEFSATREVDQMMHPMGNLKVSQKVVPLNYTLTKFGSSDPKTNFRFEIISLNNIPSSSLVSTKDYFAPAQFTEYENEEKLSLKSYDLMDSGVFFASTQTEILFSIESVSSKEISYETIVWENMANKEDPIKPEEDRFVPNANLSQIFGLAGAAYHASVSNSNELKYKMNNHDAKESTLVKEKFVIVDDNNMAVVSIPMFEGEMSQSIAINRLRDYRKANPQDKRNLKVVSSFDVVEVAA